LSSNSKEQKNNCLSNTLFFTTQNKSPIPIPSPWFDKLTNKGEGSLGNEDSENIFEKEQLY